MTSTPSIRHIFDAEISNWLHRQMEAKLRGRAFTCAVNARNFLIRAQKIAEISTVVSYFCATHATEEAVACFVSACKMAGYPEAKEINLHDHKHKAAVAAFAQFVSGHAQAIGLCIGYEPKGDALVVRIRDGDGFQYYPLGVHLFTFNEDRESDAHIEAFGGFSNLFESQEAMLASVVERSAFRDRALYASDDGAPGMPAESLALQLQDHAFLTLGLIWAAIDVVRRDKREPFIVQVLGAVNQVTSGFRRKPSTHT